MIAYSNRPQAWTPGEDDELLTYAGRRKLATIAQRLGRSEIATARRLRIHGQHIRTTATRQAGMSIRDTAAALGVTKAHVWKWINIGWLEKRPGYGVRKRYTSIDPDAVLAFLNERGALLKNIQPDPDWADEVAAARAALLSWLIAGPDLAALLSLHRGTLPYLRTRLGFPSVALRLGGCLPDYYDRQAVRAWLETHPAYRTRSAQEVLS